VVNALSGRIACLPAAAPSAALSQPPASTGVAHAVAPLSAALSPSHTGSPGLPGAKSPNKQKGKGRRRSTQHNSTNGANTAVAPPEALKPSRSHDRPDASQPLVAPAPPARLQIPGTSLEWLLDTVANSPDGNMQKELLSALVAHHWHQRCFVEGAIAVVPLLGRRVLLQV
jgi:hypothetical protein